MYLVDTLSRASLKDGPYNFKSQHCQVMNIEIHIHSKKTEELVSSTANYIRINIIINSYKYENAHEYNFNGLLFPTFGG